MPEQNVEISYDRPLPNPYLIIHEHLSLYHPHVRTSDVDTT